MSNQVTELDPVSKAGKKSGEKKRQRPAKTAVEVDPEIESVTMAIRSIVEEGKETRDLLEMEKNYSSEVIAQLKEIIRPLNAKFRISPATVSTKYPSASTGVLTSEGLVCLLDAKGTVLSKKPLEEFQIETVLRIVSEILPDVNKQLEHLQDKPSERLSAIAKITRELKKIIVGVE